MTCRYMNAIQTNAHHLLRYVANAVVVNKRRRNMLKELIKVIQQEQYSYKDPIAEFLECLYINYDFDGTQTKMHECEEVRCLILNSLLSCWSLLRWKVRPFCCYIWPFMYINLHDCIPSCLYLKVADNFHFIGLAWNVLWILWSRVLYSRNIIKGSESSSTNE